MSYAAQKSHTLSLTGEEITSLTDTKEACRWYNAKSVIGFHVWLRHWITVSYVTMRSNYNLTFSYHAHITSTSGSINSLLSTFCESPRRSSLTCCNTKTNETLSLTLLTHRLHQAAISTTNGTDIGGRNGGQNSNHSEDRKFHGGTRAKTITTEVKVADTSKQKIRKGREGTRQGCGRLKAVKGQISQWKSLRGH